jgi:membrane protease YdiL (CAAX protease family)
MAPGAAAPLALLGAACDALYLRTHNLMPPLLLHCAWNAAQLLAIAFAGKQEFV